MASRLRQAVGPAYLLVCLFLGGSIQDVWGNMALRLIGLAILAWAAIETPAEKLPRRARQLIFLILAALVWITLQLAPLPPSLWPQLGGREVVTDGYALLGIHGPWLPLSLAPYETAATLLTLIPPFALLACILRLEAYRKSWLALALLVGTLLGILLGALQVASADPETSRWYLYSDTNWGFATGFFANANHMATLLVISIPFLAALLASASRANVQRYSGVVALVAGTGMVIVVGLALNRSLAGYGLAVPVIVASALIVLPRASRVRLWTALAAAVLLVAAVVALMSSPIGENWLRAQATSSVQSRSDILDTTLNATEDFLPFGSGLGSFRQVYQLYEDHDRLDPTVYVVHAHDDYVELALETGVPGIIILLLFLAWWLAAALRVWRGSAFGPFARAAALASAAILIHSLVDFPLRTSAISACFAMCIGLMAERRRPPDANESRLWATRHLTLS